MLRNILLISIIIVGLLIAMMIYLIILAVSKNKTDEERKMEDDEQLEYIKKYNERNIEIKMERVYINRECAIAYVVMAINSILNSANKERTIDDFIEEIRTMTEIYTDENTLIGLMNNFINKNGKIKIEIKNKN